MELTISQIIIKIITKWNWKCCCSLYINPFENVLKCMNGKLNKFEKFKIVNRTQLNRKTPHTHTLHTHIEFSLKVLEYNFHRTHVSRGTFSLIQYRYWARSFFYLCVTHNNNPHIHVHIEQNCAIVAAAAAALKLSENMFSVVAVVVV